MEDLKNYLIVYHYPCVDGAYSCLVLYLYYKYFGTKYKLWFSPIKSGRTINTLLIDDLVFNKIFILDKSLNMAELDYLFNIISSRIEQGKNLKVIQIDHHLENNLEIYEKPKNIDKNFKFISNQLKSSCGLSLDYFSNKAIKMKINENEIFNGDLKTIIEYVQDSDIYEKKLEKVNEFKSGILNLLLFA